MTESIHFHSKREEFGYSKLTPEKVRLKPSRANPKSYSSAVDVRGFRQVCLVGFAAYLFLS